MTSKDQSSDTSIKEDKVTLSDDQLQQLADLIVSKMSASKEEPKEVELDAVPQDHVKPKDDADTTDAPKKDEPTEELPPEESTDKEETIEAAGQCTCTCEHCKQCSNKEAKTETTNEPIEEVVIETAISNIPRLIYEIPTTITNQTERNELYIKVLKFDKNTITVKNLNETHNIYTSGTYVTEAEVKGVYLEHPVVTLSVSVNETESKILELDIVDSDELRMVLKK